MKQLAIFLSVVFAFISQVSMAGSQVMVEKKPFSIAILTNQEALTKVYMTNPSRTFVEMFQALFNEQVKMNQKLDRLIVLMERQQMHRH